MWRVFFGYMSYLCSMFCVFFLPLYVATSALMSATFVTMLLGYFMSGEVLSCREITTIVFGLCGVIIVLNPGWFNSDPSFHHVEKVHHSSADYLIGMCFAAGYCICSAFKFIMIRAIGDNVHTSVKNYYFGFIGGVFTIIVNFFLDPGFYKVWNIGTSEYTMSPDMFYSALTVGFFGFAT